MGFLIRHLLGGTICTIAVALPFRRFRWSHTAFRASLVAGAIVFLFALWIGAKDYDVLTGALYLEELPPALAATSVLGSFLFFEWRDRSGRDVFKPMSERVARWLRRGTITIAALTIVGVGLLAWEAHAEDARRVQAFDLEALPDAPSAQAQAPDLDFRPGPAELADGGFDPEAYVRGFETPPTAAERRTATHRRATRPSKGTR